MEGLLELFRPVMPYSPKQSKEVGTLVAVRQLERNI